MKQEDDPKLEAISKLLAEWQEERDDNRGVVVMAYDNISETDMGDGVTANRANFALAIYGKKKNVARAIRAAHEDENYKPYLMMVMLQELANKVKRNEIAKNN